jgi:hypothetical protein
MIFYLILIVFNAIFNNISLISRRSVLLVEKTGPVASHKPVLLVVETGENPRRVGGSNLQSTALLHHYTSDAVEQSLAI